MLTRLNSILQHKCLIVAGKPLLVGVSGGPDSLCLLDLLYRLGIPLGVAHFNHQLREQALQDSLQVERLASELKLGFVSASMDVAAFAQENSLSIEEAARELRYRFLFSEARRGGFQAVAVGHSADDQVETVLMHLLRGAGRDGLVGMPYRLQPNPWDAEIPLIRPLLDFWREEIQAYISERDLQPVVDESNLDVSYHRNRLRLETIPYLEGINAQIRKSLWRMADVLREEGRLLDELTRQGWDVCVPEEGPGYFAFEQTIFASQEIGLQRRLIRNAMLRLVPGLRDLDFETVERGRRFLAEAGRMGRCSLIGGLSLLREVGRVWLCSQEAQLPTSDWPQTCSTEVETLTIPGVVPMQAGWVLQAEIVLNPPQDYRANQDRFLVWLEAASLPDELYVRRRQRGDRIQPLGLQGRSAKVSDLMVNAKIPQRARDGWPLVCAGEEIVWVPGCRQGMTGRVQANTERFLRLSLKKTGFRA